MASTAAVIIPVYNSGATLQETLDSAFAQTLQDLEIIVVDDGSTDPHTIAELKRIEKDDRITLIRQENGGPASARNAGLRRCTSDYFMPLDSDDLIGPTYIEEAARVLDDRPEVALVYSRAELFGDAEGPWGLPDFEWPTFLIHNLIFSSTLYRRTDAESVGGYDESMRVGREDHDFVMKILGRGGHPHRLDAVHYHYRIRNDSVNAQVGASREKLITAHASIFRNNLQTYADHAEDLFTFIFRQHDEIMDLRYRYAAAEKLRTDHPKIIGAAKSVRGAARRGRRAAQTAIAKARGRSSA